MLSESLSWNDLPTRFSTIIINAFLIVILYLVAVVFYRLYLHPLAAYPGPFLAKITDFYSVYYSSKGNRHIEFLRCHDKYGPVFRYGPNRLSFNTATALHTIYGPKANVQKSDFYHLFTVPPEAPSVFTIVNKAQHAQKRKVLAHAFSDKALKSMETYMLTHIRTFCEKMETQKEAINVSDWFSYLTCDVLGELAFGKAFGMLMDGGNRWVLDLTIKAAGYNLIVGSMLFLGKWGIPGVLFSDLISSKLRFRDFSQKHARERVQSTADRKDFYHYLLEAEDPETGFKYSQAELWGHSALLIVAGTDTTATALTTLLFYLLRNPDALEKVTNEILEFFPSGDIEHIQSGPTLNKCHYLRACIDEAMRMTPPVPGMLPREVLPGGQIVDGHSVPAGTEIGVAAYAIHHNPAIYPSSFQYKPERWLEGSEAAKGFAAFSTGPRGCIGRSMAYMEMMITMARVLRRFELRLSGDLGEGGKSNEWGRERKEEFQINDRFNAEKDGPMVEFIRRRE